MKILYNLFKTIANKRRNFMKFSMVVIFQMTRMKNTSMSKLMRSFYRWKVEHFVYS